MTGLGWRVRIWVRRLIPHTPVKRWAYAAGLGVVIAFGALLGPAAGAIALAVMFGARLLDVQTGRRRQGRMPTQRAYFFEGSDKQPPRP